MIRVEFEPSITKINDPVQPIIDTIEDYLCYADMYRRAGKLSKYDIFNLV